MLTSDPGVKDKKVDLNVVSDYVTDCSLSKTVFCPHVVRSNITKWFSYLQSKHLFSKYTAISSFQSEFFFQLGFDFFHFVYLIQVFLNDFNTGWQFLIQPAVMTLLRSLPGVRAVISLF